MGARTGDADGGPRASAIYYLARSQAVTRSRAAMLVGAWLGMLAPQTAHAVDAIWTSPLGNDWQSGSNWSGGVVPDNTAIFTNNGAHSGTEILGNATINTIRFDPGSPTYGVDIGSFTAGLDIIGAGIVNNSSSVQIFSIFGGALTFRNSATAGNAVIFNAGNIFFFDSSTAGNAAITVNDPLRLVQFSGTSSAGNANIMNNGTVFFAGSSTAANAIITTTVDSNFGFLTVLQFFNTSTAGNATIITNDGAVTTFQDGSSGGNARFITNAGGRFDVSGLGGAGTSAGSIEGAGNYFLGSKTLTVGSNNLSTEVNGVIQDGGFFGGTGGSLVKVGSGALTLSGINTYTGATTVNGGTLTVTGDISPSSGVTVNSGAMLNGTGIVPNVTVNGGGTLAPGLSPSQITINGNLGMASAAIYLIQVSSATASKANVSGSAAVGGTVDVVATDGSYKAFTKYTILTTTGGPVTGTFSGLSVIGGSFGSNVTPQLSYDANDVYLTLVANSLLPFLPSNLSINQQNVANAVNAFMTSGGTLPTGFQNLFNLSPTQIAQALTQLEDQNNAGGAQQAGYQLMNEFLLLMLNPFDSDRAGLGGAGFGAGGGVARFASDGGDDALPDDASAYAAKTPYYKASIAAAPAPKRWNVWAAAFGGSNNTNGDPNGTGSANFSAQTGAVAAGVDYKLTQDTLIGVALAGGGTSWGLAQGLGSGHSDAFQAGLYGSQRLGAWYLSGAAAFANYWASTTRQISLPAIDALNANFNAQSWGGRLEGGYRFAWGALNLAPYAAFQAQSFSTPNYSEASGSGSNQFALSYASRTGNVERSELGSWLNTLYLLQGNSVVSVFGRAAWAHDWQNTPQASATFLGLSPIASFIVNGAKPAADLGVVTAGAELRMAGGWALMGKFDGEFGSGTQTYAGTARVRYVW